MKAMSNQTGPIYNRNLLVVDIPFFFIAKPPIGRALHSNQELSQIAS